MQHQTTTPILAEPSLGSLALCVLQCIHPVLIHLHSVLTPFPLFIDCLTFPSNGLFSSSGLGQCFPVCASHSSEWESCVRERKLAMTASIGSTTTRRGCWSFNNNTCVSTTLMCWVIRRATVCQAQWSPLYNVWHVLWHACPPRLIVIYTYSVHVQLILCNGGVCAYSEGCMHTVRGVCIQWRVCAYSEGCVHTVKGVCIQWGVCAYSEGCVHTVRGVCMYVCECVGLAGCLGTGCTVGCSWPDICSSSQHSIWHLLLLHLAHCVCLLLYFSKCMIWATWQVNKWVSSGNYNWMPLCLAKLCHIKEFFWKWQINLAAFDVFVLYYFLWARWTERELL